MMTNLDPTIQQKIRVLSGNSANNSRHDSKYNSNAFGLTAFLYDIKVEGMDDNQYPEFLSQEQIQAVVSQFSRVEEEKKGDLVCFHGNNSKEGEYIIQTWLLIGNHGQIFHEIGTGGQYCTEKIDFILNEYISQFKDCSEVKYYRKK